MHTLMPTGAIMLAACCSVASAQLIVDRPITPIVELQSGPLTPGFVLDECPRPIHQIRILVDAKLDRGVLVLDSNAPEFDEFGGLVGGILTPQVRGDGGPLPAVKLGCVIELVKESREKWRLYRISGSEIRTPLRIATLGSIGDGGPARLVVLGPDKKAKAVVECTRYGLAVP